MNIESLNFSDPQDKRSKVISVNVPSYIDAQYGHGDTSYGILNSYEGKLDYRQFGMFTSEIRKREIKAEEKAYSRVQPGTTGEKTTNGAPIKRARGRKTKSKVLAE